MKRLTIISSLLLYAAFVHGQSTDITTFFMSNTRKADIYYNKLAYKNAIELYERVLDKNPGDLNARTRIAECYVQLNLPDGAVTWYRTVVNEPGIEPIHWYNYAQALSSLGNYEEARIWYENYKDAVPEDRRSYEKLAFLDDLEFHSRDSTLYDIIDLDINTENSEFGATLKDNELIFLSSRDEDLFIKYEEDDEDIFMQAPFDAYVSLYSDSVMEEARKLHTTINTKFHEGPLTFYHDRQRVIFTRSNYHARKKGESSDGKIKLKLFTAELNSKEDWSNVRPFPYNNDEYSTAHPSLSADNQILFFTSDMPGGFGGSDIYYCRWIDNSWSEPTNVGLPINTPGDEVFPFVSEDGHLFFSSDGHGGFGGLDIFRATEKNGHFVNVENLGYPMNTSSDDFSFSIDADGREGFISSNRQGGKGSDDIYKYNVKFKSVVGVVVESRTRENIGNAMVDVFDSLTNSYTQVEANEEGYFRLDLPLDTYFDLLASKEDYGSETPTRVDTHTRSFETDTVTVLLWRHELFAQGRVFSNETQELLEGTRVTLENLNDSTVTELETSDDGVYNFVLRPDNVYIIQAEKPDHITSNFRLNTSGMIADTLLNDFVLEEEYVDKEVVFFGFDDATILPDATLSLNLMVRNLKRYKDTYIVISAHADAQGTYDYNLALSNRRALAVVNYLKRRGIADDRITWRGFGEQLLINRCSDGVECPEEEHSKNRRAELKIEEEKSETPLDPEKK